MRLNLTQVLSTLVERTIARGHLCWCECCLDEGVDGAVVSILSSRKSRNTSISGRFSNRRTSDLQVIFAQPMPISGSMNA